MRVAFLSSEAVPFAKTGGLADVAGALPKALRKCGADAALFVPMFGSIDRQLLAHKEFESLDVMWRGALRTVDVWFSEAAGTPAYLIDEPSFFGRDGIYGYRDDHERFAFFCRAALDVMRVSGAPPDVLHCNDWPCGFAAAELRDRRGFDPFFARTRTLFSIHNIAYQGNFDPGELEYLGYSREARNAFLKNGSASALKAGLMMADVLSTVSRRYALEIQTHDQGCGLDWVLRGRSDRLFGITNGVDYEVWNPATDQHIPARYSADDLPGKLQCKLALLKSFGLPEDSERPLIAMISRLIAQKGYDLIAAAAEEILDRDVFFVALGSGAGEYEHLIQHMRDRRPDRVGVYRGFNEPLSHQAEAGADIFLMPSLYEPCGLNQMYSMRYGTVPVVRATGGLDDTVEDFDRLNGRGTGFKFSEYSALAMLEKIDEAIYCYSDSEIWRQIQLNGMLTDNSWDAAAHKYLNLYNSIELY